MAAAFAAASALAASEEKENEAYRYKEAQRAAASRSEHLAAPSSRQVRGIDRRFRDVTSRVFSPRPRASAHAAVKLEKTTLAPTRGSQDAVSRGAVRGEHHREAPTGTGTPSNASSFRNGCCARRCSSARRSLRARGGTRASARRERESLRRRADDRLACLRSIPGRARGQLGGSPHRELLPPEDRSHVEGTSRPAAAPLAVPPASRGRETFYFEAEHRRLTWLRSSLPPRDGPRRNPGDLGGLSQFLAEGVSDADTLARIQPEAPPRPRPRGFARRNARFNANAPIFVDWRQGSKPQLDAIFAQVHLALQTSQSVVGRDGVERRGVRGRGGRRTDRRRCWDGVVVVAAAEIQSPGGRAAAPEEVPRRRRRRMIVSLARPHAELVLQLRGMDAMEDMFDGCSTTSTSAALGVVHPRRSVEATPLSSRHGEIRQSTGTEEGRRTRRPAGSRRVPSRPRGCVLAVARDECVDDADDHAVGVML